MRNFDELICELLEVDDIQEDQKLIDAENWGSLTMLCIIASMETEYGVKLTYKQIMDAQTIGGLKKLIK